MKLVVRVQYIGDRARMLLREELAGEYTKGLIDDLSMFGFPMPHEQKPIEKSGFMLCVYHVDRDSEMHHSIQTAFAKAKQDAPYLIDRSIRYISLNEDGIMHTTNMTQKPYKPKSAYKPPEPPAPSPFQQFKQPYGKAPKYPSTISQARHAVGPLPQRMGGDPGGPSGGFVPDYGDHEMKYGKRSPRTGGEEGPSSMIDNTQQTLMQLSQSSAFQSLLQNANPALPGPSKPEPAPSSEFPMLSRQPPPTLPQTQIPNLQALLEKAGVRSSTAHAFLQNPQNQYHPASSNLSMGPSSPIASGSGSTSMFSPMSPTASSSMPSQSTSMAGSSAAAGSSILRPPTATPRVPTLRELWDIRREITALQARGRTLAAALRAAGQQIPLGPEDATPPSMTGGDTGSGADLMKLRELEGQIYGLQEKLTRETDKNKLMEATLRAQRARHTEVEDVKREMREPFVVPAILDAFMKIGQITDEERIEAGPSSGGHESMEY